MALGPGSIAFTGFNADGSDNLAFVALTDLPLGTVIHFTENEWLGTSFNSGEGAWSWTATSDIAAGTIVRMDALTTSPTSNLGTIATTSAVNIGLSVSNEIVYAYVGASDAPTAFLAAIANDAFTASGATLAGTGLAVGVNALTLASKDGDIGAYAGPRLTQASLLDYLPLINNPDNWVTQGTGAEESADGVPPDAPFSLSGFSADPSDQIVTFSAASLAVSQAEGDSGDTVFTFTVERSGSTIGEVSFSGSIFASGTTRADDFGGAAPVSFTGTIAEGQTSGIVTVHVSGDTVFERDEKFTLSLEAVSNNDANAVLGEGIVATGTIANDDPAPASIAFVGFNGEGADNLAFLAVSDIAAGTVIHFTDNEWTGSSFNTGESMWSWTAGSDIAAGTVITMDGLNSGAASSNHGTISFTSGTGADIDENNILDQVYAYLGTPGAPTAFLTAISNGGFGPTSQGGLLTGTALTAGVNAMALAPARVDIAYYNGPRTGFTSYEDYLPHIYNPANWIGQDTSADNTADGILPDLPFPALPFSTDPTVQVVQFASGSLSVTQPEGDSGDTAFTFTVERINGTDGDLDFTVRVPVGTYATAANAADFGGDTLPAVSGTIPDGASSTTVTILVKGESLFEVNERFLLILESASNPDASSVVIGNNSIATGTIDNDDAIPDTILDGETHTATIIVTGQDHLVIEQGGAVVVPTGSAISWIGTNTDVVIENAGLIGGSITSARDTTGTLTINNLQTGVIRGVLEIENVDPVTNVTLNNAGLIELNDRIDFRDAADVGTAVINNLAGGVILQTAGGRDIMRPGANGVVNNHGSILHAPGLAGGGDGADFQNDPGVVNNYANGVIEASRHAVTGDAPVQVFNAGTMIGRNGSAVNIDNGGSEAERVFVTNRGRMEGRSANLADSDGDAVDIDGLLTLKNYGFIGGMGHNGYHDGEPNVSEGVAIGGGTIANYAGGEIYGYGRAIQVDNSSNSNALGTTIIVNHGLIRGDGNLPTAVTPEEVAEFAQRIRGGEAINLLGTYADSLTNTGQIVGGVKMGGGDDRLVNAGTMTATGGSAIDMGDGNDTVTLREGSQVTGAILLGAGDDRFVGSSGNETVDGGDGNDRLDGGLGADEMAGGAGDDTFYVDNAEDQVLELADAGIDRVISSITYALGDHVENLTLTGTAANSGFGNGLDNRIVGNGAANVLSGEDGNDRLQGMDGDDTLLGGTGNDILDGGTGADLMAGGLGNDVYVVDNAGDQVIEVAGQGTDRVNAAIDFTLGSTLENLTLTGDAAIDGTGNALDNVITGNAAANALDGGTGNDVLRGGAGSDVLLGGVGADRLDGGSENDLLIGGAGNDLITGGDGSDVIALREGFGTDRVLDFGADDFIDLRGFGYASGQAVVNSFIQVGANVILGLATGDQLTLQNVQKADLDAGQFIVADAGTAAVSADVLALMQQHLV